MSVQPLDPATRQVTMTLAAIAATGATPRPSGETQAQQLARIEQGIASQLACTDLATQGAWQLAWLAMSPDNANLAYVAWNSSANALAVVIRGTVASNATDLLEDFDVGTVVPFTPFTSGGQPAAVSKGAMDAFTQIVSMSGSDGSTLVQVLAEVFRQVPNPTVYVVGHSLGGCIATMVAPYLQAQTWTNANPAFALSTFAAPTAGDQNFADYVNSVQWAANEHCFNAWDLIPQAWANLDVAQGWYPTPGPAANLHVKAIITAIASLAGPNAYVQPGYSQAINTVYGPTGSYDQDATLSSVEDFMTQVAFQHSNSQYLRQLGATVVNPGPEVTSISPTSGTAGTEITITGSGFGKDPGQYETVVDFGTTPCEKFSVNGDTQITCTVPEGTGVVDVRVTNILGTSPTSPFLQFAYGGPQPAVVNNIYPTSGTVDTKVNISGVAFAPNPVVYFGNKPASIITASSTELYVRAPLPDQSPTAPSVVNVRVLTNGYLTPAYPSNEFTYTGP
jgi:hypothetical protein